MKHRLALVLFMAALSIAPLVAGDAAPKATPVRQKIREIDLNIMLKQYEYVATQLAEMRLKVRLLEIEEGLTDAERKGKLATLRKKIELMQSISDEYRAEAEWRDDKEKSSTEAAAK